MSDLTERLRHWQRYNDDAVRMTTAPAARLSDDLTAAADALEAAEVDKAQWVALYVKAAKQCRSAEAKLAAIDALCARHDITVEGIVALVDDTFRAITEPEHADITEAVEAGLNRDDMYYAGWEVGWHDAVTAARRLARGEEA